MDRKVVLKKCGKTVLYVGLIALAIMVMHKCCGCMADLLVYGRIQNW